MTKWIPVILSILTTYCFGMDDMPQKILLDENEPKDISFKHDDFEIVGELGSFRASWQVAEAEKHLYVVTLKLQSPTALTPPKFSFKWKVPSVDITSFWTPNISMNKANYYGNRVASRAARYAPVLALYNNADVNRMTVACSDALNGIELRSRIIEEDANFHSTVTFFSEKTPARKEYQVQIRIDTRPIPYYQALKEVSQWWAAQENYKPATVPDHAKWPLYSTWYSFHQSITADTVVEQCRLAKDLGFKAVIVDDGWQTLDSKRGYAFTGDWKPERIPDMKDFVDRIHRLGMKFMLWYSVPLVGKNSANYEKFKGKYLWHWESQGSSVLDPRFPEVREFIISTYEKALEDWNLDGFKLDFIGMFRPDENTVFEASGGRDFASIDEAVDRLMTDIMARLRTAKPDIMIEFRQPYIGPLMRKYGNMFRGTDCPNMALVNRVETTDIRLLAGDTAVHSDMFVWHSDDSVETAALQILNILFAVPQLSVLLDEVPEEHIRMVRFWINYWNENRSVLLDGEFVPVNPSANYPMIKAETPDKTIVAVYNDMVVRLGRPGYKMIDIVNAKAGNSVVIDLAGDIGAAAIKVYDCTGELTDEKVQTLNAGVRKILAPASGLVTIEKQ